METINAIILLLSTALPLIVAAITFIAKFIKSDKAKKAAESLIEINDVIEEFMVKAEGLTGYTGQQKKSYVLRCVKNYALSDGLEFNEANVDKVIEKLINFSKDVNKEKYCSEITAEAKPKRTKTDKRSINKYLTN